MPSRVRCAGRPGAPSRVKTSVSPFFRTIGTGTLGRSPTAASAPLGPVRIGAAEFDIERGELRDANGPIRLTGGEAALLTALARKPNEVLSREDIAEALGMDDSGERAIDVQVVRLRRKIEADPREPRFLHTVRGRGYVLKPGI